MTNTCFRPAYAGTEAQNLAATNIRSKDLLGNLSSRKWANRKNHENITKGEKAGNRSLSIGKENETDLYVKKLFQFDNQNIILRGLN